MMAIFLLELARCLRWCIAAGVVVLIILLSIGHHITNRSPFADSELLTILTWIAAAAGTGMGIAHWSRDGSGPWWALLTHRPISRTRIAAAKALAAVVCLATTLLAPILLAAMWWALPTPRLPPFDFACMGPVLPCLGSSLIAYLVAAHCAIRRGRWWASRALPAIPAVLSVAILSEQGPWGEKAVILLLGVVLGVPLLLAWIQAAGEDEAVPVWGRAAWTTSILLVIIPCCGVVLEQVQPTDASVLWQHALDAHGNVDVCRWGSEGRQVFDLHLHPLPTQTRVDASVAGTFSTKTSGSMAQDDPNAYGTLVRSTPEQLVWWMGHQRRLIVCDARTGVRLGDIAPEGLAAAPTPWDVTLVAGAPVLQRGQAVWRLPPHSNVPQLLFREAPDEHICGRLWGNDVGQAGSDWYVTSRRLIEVRSDGTLAASYPFQVPGGTYTIEKSADDLLLLAGDGDGARDVQMHLHPPSNAELTFLPPLPTEAAPRLVAPVWLLPLTTPVLLHAVPWKPAQAWPWRAGAVIGIITAALLAAGAIELIGRRWGIPGRGRGCWELLALCMGPATILPFLALRGGGARERCMACGGWRPPHHLTCPHCGHTAKAPAPSPLAIVDAAEAWQRSEAS